MKKTAVLLSLLLILACLPMGQVFAQDSITVIADGTPVSFDVAPAMENDRVLVPLRAVGEALGACVQWMEDTQTVIISRRGIRQTLTLGVPQATIEKDYEKQESVLDVAPFTVNDRTMVPLRYIAEGFQARVDWDEATSTVTVTAENPVVMTINGTDITEGIYNFHLCNSEQNPELTEENLLFMFAFNQIAEEAGIVLTEQDILDSVGAASQQEYDEIKQDMLRLGLTEEEFDLMSRSSAYGNTLYQYKAESCSSQELQQFYQDNYVTAKHILLTTEGKEKEEVKKEAEQLLARLKKGESFDELMQQHSQDPGLENYPNGYTFTKNEMTEAFEKTAFALQIGEISDLVETDYGYHIIWRLPLEEKFPEEMEELRYAFAYQFMISTMEQASVSKNQALIDSFNPTLRSEIYRINSSVWQEFLPEE